MVCCTLSSTTIRLDFFGGSVTERPTRKRSWIISEELQGLRALLWPLPKQWLERMAQHQTLTASYTHLRIRVKSSSKERMENHIGNLQASKETKMLQKDGHTFLKWMRNSWKKFAKLWKGRRNSETWLPPWSRQNLRTFTESWKMCWIWFGAKPMSALPMVPRQLHLNSLDQPHMAFRSTAVTGIMSWGSMRVSLEEFYLQTGIILRRNWTRVWKSSLAYEFSTEMCFLFFWRSDACDFWFQRVERNQTSRLALEAHQCFFPERVITGAAL